MHVQKKSLKAAQGVTEFLDFANGVVYILFYIARLNEDKQYPSPIDFLNGPCSVM
jgi:hypothetical protein